MKLRCLLFGCYRPLVRNSQGFLVRVDLCESCSFERTVEGARGNTARGYPFNLNSSTALFFKMYDRLTDQAKRELVFQPYGLQPRSLSVVAIEVRNNTKLGKELLTKLGFTTEQEKGGNNNESPAYFGCGLCGHAQEFI